MKRYQCKICGNMKNTNELYEDSKRETGYKTDACRECVHDRYIKNRSKKIEYQKEWNAEHPEKLAEYNYRYRNKKRFA